MRWMILVALCAAPALADSTLPDAPEAQGAWVNRCVERLKRAQADAAQKEPGFSSGEIMVEKKPPGVRFDAKLPDAEHARFYPKQPAHYTLRVVEKKSKQAGTLGGGVGKASDSQASFSLGQWTLTRSGTMDVQVAGGRAVHLFSQVFQAALEDCLR
jgi:hypothetical protein